MDKRARRIAMEEIQQRLQQGGGGSMSLHLEAAVARYAAGVEAVIAQLEAQVAAAERSIDMAGGRPLGH